MLATGVLPRTDPYSFTRGGERWFAWEWGADALMGAAHRLAGLPGVATLFACAIAASTWLWFKLQWIAGTDFLVACALAPLLLSTTHIHWLARPHVLSWLFLLVALIEAEHAAERVPAQFRARHVAAVAAVVAVWTNLHASFFFAPLIALLYALAHWARPLIWDLDCAAEHARARWFLLAAGVAAAATLVNPYGWQLHRHVAAYLGDSELLARIGEFQSFNFHAEGAFQILLTVAVAMVGGIAALAQKRIAHFLLAALLTAAALRSARGLPLVALLVLPIAGGAITRALESARLRWPLRLRLDAFLAYSRGLRAIDSSLSGWVWAPVAIGLAAAWLSVPAVAARTGFPPDQFPVAGAERVAALPDDARLLAPDKFGGYLIYRFAGRRKVFFDGRSDLYGSEFMKQYARLMQVRPGWREQLDAYHFTHALLPNDYSLIPALESLGWKPLYRDAVATLLERP